MGEIIHYICPDCQNDEFEVIKVLAHSKPYHDKKHREIGYTCGYYRCECTSCELVLAVKTKNPMLLEENGYYD